MLTSTAILPKIYLRFVDDIFVIWDEGKGEHEDFLELLNEQNPNIVLVQEKEQERSLPFLDVQIKRPKIDAWGSLCNR